MKRLFDEENESAVDGAIRCANVLSFLNEVFCQLQTGSGLELSSDSVSGLCFVLQLTETAMEGVGRVLSNQHAKENMNVQPC